MFFQVQATYITTQFLGSLLSAALMIWSPWVPMLLGLSVEFVSIIILPTIPETLHYNDQHSASPPSPDPTAATPDNPLDDAAKSRQWHAILRSARNSVSFLTSDKRILQVIAAFFVHMLFANRDVMLQYISSRYHVSLAYATTLIAVRSGLVLLLFVVLLPTINFYSRRRFGPRRSDLFLARTSGAIFVLSFLGVGLAPKLPFLVSALVLDAFGWGFFSFLRSLATSLVEAHHVARLNSFIGVLDTIGLMIGSPLLAALFAKSLELGGIWLGLPFLFDACLVAAATLMLVIVVV